MNKMYGWAGKILRIDLASRENQEVPTDTMAEKFIGGRGFTAKVYRDEVSKDTDALSPESPLVIMTGPLAGTGAIAGITMVHKREVPAHLSFPIRSWERRRNFRDQAETGRL